MQHRLATKFDRRALTINSRTPLEDAQLRAACPAIFATEPHGSRSARYEYVPTSHVLQGLRSEGWQPFFAAQALPRDIDRLGFAKHMIRLRRQSDIGAAEAAEIILVNSHDGSTSYQMFAGLLRFVCTNSLVAGDRFEEVRVHHKGNIRDDVIEGAYTIAEEFPRLLDGVQEMKALQLTGPEQSVFAEAALVARYGEADAPIRPDQLLRPRRVEDRGQTLWQTLNVVQENVIRGGVTGFSRDERGRVRSRRTRAIGGIDQNVGVYRARWPLAEGRRALKAASPRGSVANVRRCHPRRGMGPRFGWQKGQTMGNDLERPEVHRMLAVSTAHARGPGYMDNMAADAPVFDKGRFGWFVAVSDCVAPPAWMAPLWAYALALGCTWIMFDRDAECVDGLPRWDW